MINKDKFIIMADATEDKSDLKSLELYKQSGMNTFNLYPNELDHYGAIERAGQAGLDVIVFGGSIVFESNKQFFPYAIGLFTNFTERYIRENVDLNRYKHLTGLYVIDEPSVKLFDLINEKYIPWFNKSYAGKKIWHVNLLPSYASKEQFGFDYGDGQCDYEYYINRYAEEVLSKVNGIKTIGVDHYALFEKDGIQSLSKDWLYDFAVVADAAKRYNAIYSVCIQCYRGDGLKNVDCTADIRCQLYVAMAFGASMFEFYAYSASHGVIGMLGVDGEPIDVYYAVRDAVKEIKAFEKEYLKYDLVGLKTYLPKDGKCEAFDRIQKFEIASLNGIESVKVTRETIVSEFTCDGKSAFMVVNYGLPAISKSDVVELAFTNAKKLSVYQNGRKDAVSVIDGTAVLYLEPGQGVFVIIEE